MSDEVKHGAYECGFCNRRIPVGDLNLHPCGNCLVPEFLEVLKGIESNLENLSLLGKGEGA